MSLLGSRSAFGHRLVDSTGDAVPYSVASLTALKAIEAADRVHGMVAMVDADQSEWYFHSSSALTGDDILVVSPSAGTGKWLRKPGFVDLALPCTSATADGATLLTFQAGQLFQLQNTYVKVTTAWTGGSSSAIGLDSDKTGFDTAGDVAGGAGGDLEAGLTAGTRPGTIGAKLDADTELHDALFASPSVVRFQRIVSAFTAGAGEYHLCGHLIRNAGA